MARTTASARSSSPARGAHPAIRSPSTERRRPPRSPVAHLDPLGGAAPPAAPRVSAPRVDRAPRPGAWTPPLKDGRQAGLQLAAAARRQPLGLEARASAAGRGRGAARAASSRSRATCRAPRARVAGRHPARRLQLGDEVRVELGRGERQLQQLAARRRSARRPAPASRRRPGSRPPAGSARSSTATSRPALRSRQAQPRPIDAAADDHRVDNCASRSSLASAGITRIRSRRSVASLPPSQPSRAPVHHRCYPSPRQSSAATAIIGAMSLAPPEGDGPLRRERLRTARLYFVCDARPARRRSRAAAARGAGRRRRHRPAAREGAAAARDRAAPRSTFRRLCDTYSALFIVNDDPDLARGLRRRRGPRRPGRHAGRARRGSCSGPTRSSASRPTPRSRSPPPPSAPVDYISVGPIWETPTKAGPARRSASSSISHAAAARAPSLLRDRRHRRRQRRRRWSRPGRGGSASCGRSATPPTPAAAAEALRGAFGAIGEAAPGG